MTPLIFLPGLLCDARLWRDQAQAVSDITLSSIADLTQDDSVTGMATRVLASAPERFALAGLSMGGYVAFEILRQAPERVTKLALFSTSAHSDTPQRRRARQISIASMAAGRFVGVTRRMLPQLVHARHIDDAVGDEVRAMAARVGAEAFVRQQTAILSRPDSRPGLAAITVPTLIAVGDSDQMASRDAAETMHQAIAGSQLHILPDCGHLPPLEVPDLTTKLLRMWLEDM